MIDCEAKAADLMVKFGWSGLYPIVQKRIAQALRECAAQAYEDAANISAGVNHLGVVKIQFAIRAKASALRQPISVTQSVKDSKENK